LSCVILIPGGLVIADFMKQYPLLASVGAAVLGWTAGEMIAVPLVQFGKLRNSELMYTIIPLVLAITVVTSPSWWPVRTAGGSAHTNPKLGQ